MSTPIAHSAPKERVTIHSPKDVADLVQADMAGLEQEPASGGLLLNSRHELVGVQEIYVGTVYATVVRAAEVFRPVLQPKDGTTRQPSSWCTTTPPGTPPPALRT